MNQGKLYNYGIQNEESDIRVHVCPIAKRVYVYPTACGLAAVKSGKHPKKSGYQKGFNLPTATGYLVPPFQIKRCVSIKMRDSVWASLNFKENETTIQKGTKAERLVEGMILNGLLPIPALTKKISRKDLQIKGQDIIIPSGAITQTDIRIQVKCDFPGGEKSLGGTGNLFLQVQERNPGNCH